MKNAVSILILSIICLMNNVNAQLVTISETHQLPAIGDTVHYVDANTFGFDPTGVGLVTAKVWDESLLMNAGTTYDFYYVDPAGIPVNLGRDSFPTATIAKGETGSTGYFYYQNTANDINRLGWFIDAGTYGIYKNGTYATEFHFPISAGQNVTSTYNGKYAPFNVGEDSVNIESGSVSITADMQGTMILPTSAFNDALRLHVSETFHIKPYLLGVPVLDEIVNDDYYYWFIDSILQPIILYGITTIDGTAQPPVLRYQPIVGASIGVSDIARIVPSIYPNPSNGKFILNDHDFNREECKLDIFNLQGEQIQFNRMNNKELSEIDISNYPKGIYFVKIYSDRKMRIEKLVIQ